MTDFICKLRAAFPWSLAVGNVLEWLKGWKPMLLSIQVNDLYRLQYDFDVYYYYYLLLLLYNIFT